MTDFLIAIQVDLIRKNVGFSQEQMSKIMKSWQDWFARRNDKNKSVAPLKKTNVDGWISVKRRIYDEVRDEDMIKIEGVLLIRAKDYDEAVEIAKGYPIIRNSVVAEVWVAVYMT